MHLFHMIRKCAVAAWAVCVAAFGAAAQDGSSAYSFLNVTSCLIYKTEAADE